MILLVDSGVSQNFTNLAALKSSDEVSGALPGCKHKEAIIRLADGTLVKSEGVYAELAVSFSDLSCKEKFTARGMEVPYDLILGMPWLVKQQP